MCYHISQTPNKINSDQVKERYGTTSSLGPLFSDPKGFHFNGFDHPEIVVLADDNPRVFQAMTWGLVPFWVKTTDQAKQMAKKTLNAKSETVFDLGSFRSAILKRRCIIPVDGFYEWMHYKGKTYPHYIFPKDGSVFSLAGLWEEWTDKSTGEIVRSFSVLTTPANDLMEKIHNTKKRMPLILNPELELDWLSNGLTKEELASLMVPFDPAEMDFYTIGRRITSRTDESNVEEVKKPETYPELSPGLFG